ncbi:MAG: hypothetical protein ACYDEG_05185 [bacterium]
MHKNRRLSGILFGLASICFLLPWGNVGLGNYHIAGDVFNGVALILTTLSLVGLMTVIILIVSIAGLCLSFIKNKVGIILSIIMSGLGLIMLPLIMFKIQNYYSKYSGVIGSNRYHYYLNYDFGFFLMMIFFIAAGIINVYSLN